MADGRWHGLMADSMASLSVACQEGIQHAAALSAFFFAALQLHFTDIKSCRLILNSMGIRASTVGQLGGGVSVCLQSLVGFDWGQSWVDFSMTVGKALWGRYPHPTLCFVPHSATVPQCRSATGRPWPLNRHRWLQQVV